MKHYKNTAYMIFGLGMGLDVYEIFEEIHASSVMMIFEPNAEIIERLRKIGIFNEMFFDKRVSVHITSDREHMYKAMAEISASIMASRFEYVMTNGYRESYPEAAKGFLTAFRDNSVNKLVERSTTLFFYKLWQENLTRNVPFALESLWHMDFLDKFKGKPAILVSAGPSLDKNVHHLRELNGRAVILCVYTALRTLIKNGVRPDMVISVDATQTHKETEDFIFDIPLIYSFTTETRLLKNHTGKKILILMSLGLGNMLINRAIDEEFCVIITGGSVACAGIDFLNHCGCDPIILIGQDLAFTGLKTHASNTFYGEDTKLQNTLDMLIVDGINDDKVYTSPPLLSFKLWFETYFKNSGKTFIDASEGGALIRHTSVRPLKAVIDDLSPDDTIQNTLEEIFIGEPFIRGDRRKAIIDLLYVVCEQMEDIRESAKAAVEICEHLIDMCENGDSAKIPLASLDELDRLDIRFKKCNELKMFLDFPLGVSSILACQTEETDFTCYDSYVLEMSRLLYSHIFWGIEQCMPVLKQSLRDMRKRYDFSTV